MEVDDRFVDLNPRTCVVLGGRGFLGRSLVLRLLKLPKWIVRIADSPESLELDPSEHDSLLSDALLAGRASYFHVDVRDKDQIVAGVSFSLSLDSLCFVAFGVEWMELIEVVLNFLKCERSETFSVSLSLSGELVEF